MPYTVSPMRLLTRKRPEAEAELLHPHPGGFGHDEMAELVGQDQEPQSHDGHDDAYERSSRSSHLVRSSVAHSTLAGHRASPHRSTAATSSYVPKDPPARLSATTASTTSDIPRKRQAPIQEGVHRHLVGGVERAGAPVAPARRPRGPGGWPGRSPRRAPRSPATRPPPDRAGPWPPAPAPGSAARRRWAPACPGSPGGPAAPRPPAAPGRAPATADAPPPRCGRTAARTDDAPR